MSTQKPVAAIECPFCESPNPADRRFCQGCGEELTDECPQCRFKMSAGDSFCGGCGHNVKKHYEEQAREIENRLSEAELLVVDNKFDDAISVLSLLSRHEHPRLRSTLEKVQRLYQQVKEKRDQKVKEVIGLCDKAREYVATGLISSAIEQLESVPTHMLPAKAKALLGELRFQFAQVQSLKKEIREQIQQKNVRGILPKVAKLLESSPEENEYRELGEKLTKRVMAELKKSIVGARYEEALRWSSDLVPPFAPPAARKLIDVARERRALEYVAQNQAVADRSLLEVMQRLQKLETPPSGIEQLLNEATQLASAKLSEPHLDLRVRSKTEKSVVPGIQPWRMAGLGGVRFAKSEFGTQATQFLDAIGLALQAVADVPLKQSFAESKSGSWLSVFGSKRSKAAWGIVIDGQTLRAAHLTASSDSKSPLPIVDQLVTLRDDEAVLTDGSRQTTQNLLARMLSQLKAVPGDVCLGLAPRKVLPRFFSLPSADSKKLGSAIEMELLHQSPFGKDDVIIRHESLSESGQPKPTIMGTIVRKSDLRELTGICESLGITPALIQSSPQALFNAARYEFSTTGSKLLKGEQGLVLLDVQDDYTVYLSASENRFWWRYFPLGLSDLRSVVAKDLKLTNEQAAKVLAHPAAAPRFDKLLDATAACYENFVAEVQRCENQAEQFMKGIKVPKLLITGRNLPWLVDILRNGADAILPWSEVGKEDFDDDEAISDD